MSVVAVRCGDCNKPDARYFRGKESGRTVIACSSQCAQRVAASLIGAENPNSLEASRRAQYARDKATKWEDDGKLRRETLELINKTLIDVVRKMEPMEMGHYEVFVSVAEIREFADQLRVVCSQLEELVPKLPENKRIGDEFDVEKQVAVDRDDFLYRLQLFYANLRALSTRVRNGTQSMHLLDQVCDAAAKIRVVAH